MILYCLEFNNQDVVSLNVLQCYDHGSSQPRLRERAEMFDGEAMRGDFQDGEHDWKSSGVYLQVRWALHVKAARDETNQYELCSYAFTDVYML